jgi:ketosteroid isomerase-like protein
MAKALPFLLLFFFVAPTLRAQSSADRQAILRAMDEQTQAWNAGNLDQFMNGYWQSDSLKFIGSSGITYGWQNTLDRYRKNYPDQASRGSLRFEILSVDLTSKDAAFVIGRFFLTRPQKGDASGYFTLLWRKIGGQWKIVVDHTS